MAGRLTRRLQILIDEDRYRRLRARAAREGKSVGVYVRDAIDTRLGDDDATAREAADSFLAAPALPVAEPDELTRELEQAYERGV